MRQKGLI